MMGRDTKRMACAVRALNNRIATIVAEMESALRQRDEHYRLGDALLDEFDDLARQRFAMTRALWKAEQALSEAAFAETEAINSGSNQPPKKEAA